ncbi:cytosolic sulfotransferase 12-like [Cornus florida]|uniref:cytosolic sulfotransferase 12-like n=1 Tax=Cornus florida TaxID=4283 RepID=UPI00289E11DE|nr:cytosolic sulfotransferase 12-like [Cornus florida]
MENTNALLNHSSHSLKPLLDQLPKQCFWDDLDLHQWEGFWYLPRHLEAAKSIQAHFEARDDDVILVSSIKTGTNWLKALCFSIMQRQTGSNDVEEEDPLVKIIPTLCVRTLEAHVYTPNNPSPNLSGMPSPRLFHTHLSYNALSDSIKNSGSKIVYITRNPKDTLVSMWHFFNSTRTPEQGPYPFEKAFEGFCDGIHPFGPFFDHVLEYWMESSKMPHKILFLKYEDLKSDPKGELKRLASFLGRPFVEEEEEIDKLLWRCSLERLKNLEVNKNGSDPASGISSSAFLRLGVVGDWKNNFTTGMKERLDQITSMKLEGSGLQLET